MTRHAVSAAVATFVLIAGSLPLMANSHVRIVRLSSIEGQVQADRGTGGLERAILNTPIVEGTRLVTGSDGLAEVEFENESALRLTGDSEVKFSQLLMSDTGAKINQIQVVKGLVYLDAASRGDDTYRLLVGDHSFLVRRDTTMRLSVTPQNIQVAVFKGNVQLENQPQPVNIQKKETLTLNVADDSNTVAKSVAPVRFDAWNKEREDYSKDYAENEGYGGPSRGYGLQDLNYYGGFFYAPGFGYAWQPFGFANTLLGWDPYSNGAWMFYPGLGYTWASAYPWGWLPFHYGSWAFINSVGWAWLPGGGYGGPWYASNFQTVPRITKAPAGWTPATPPAILASAKSAQPTVFVGKGGITALSIPGGRIPPKFGSVVPGRVTTTAVNKSFVKPSAQPLSANHDVFAAHGGAVNNMHSGGHVFAPRASAGSSFGGGESGEMFGGRSTGVTAVGGGHAGVASSGAHTGSSGGSSGGSHK